MNISHFTSFHNISSVCLCQKAAICVPISGFGGIGHSLLCLQRLNKNFSQSGVGSKHSNGCGNNFASIAYHPNEWFAAG